MPCTATDANYLLTHCLLPAGREEDGADDASFHTGKSVMSSAPSSPVPSPPRPRHRLPSTSLLLLSSSPPSKQVQRRRRTLTMW